jgi:thymidylate synthase
MIMDNLWIDTLAEIEVSGTKLMSRNGSSTEVIGYTGKLENVQETFLFNTTRKLSPYYACAEFLWYLSMTDDTTFLQKFAPGYERFCEDGIHAFGAYGNRWRTNARISAEEGYADGCQNQLEGVISTLKHHPESRQAVMTMWDGTDLVHAIRVDKKDLPCTLTHQFLLRDGYLHLVTNMRSNDVWMGMPYDVFCNTQLLKLVADVVGATPGSYTHNVGSMHFYEKNFASIDAILSSKKRDIVPYNPLPQSRHHVGISDASIQKQTLAAIDFVCGLEGVGDLSSLHSTIADCGYVCAHKFSTPEVRRQLIDGITDPQLAIALEDFCE